MNVSQFDDPDPAATRTVSACRRGYLVLFGPPPRKAPLLHWWAGLLETKPVTELVDVPGRGHSLTIDHRCEVAEVGGPRPPNESERRPVKDGVNPS